MVGDSGAGTQTLRLAGGDSAELVERSFVIEVVEGPDAGRSAEVIHGMVLGSGHDANLILSDPTVSRRHAELRILADGVLVVDLGSKNGTRVFGISVREALVIADATFSLGSSVIQLRETHTKVPVTCEGTVRFGDFLTSNQQLAAQLQVLRRVAKSEATVLLEGPTGTGKELLARALHEASARAERPFVVVDCGAVRPVPLERELFGHKDGAFRDAIHDHRGAFEVASSGTVFLDKIDELQLGLQPKLLRAIEGRTIRRVGEVTDHPIDVRFVAATHRDLESMVHDKMFRDDLYYRVAVVRAKIPRLADRLEDVALLATHYAKKLSGGRVAMSPDAYSTLAQYDWPGNARELRNVIQRALATTVGNTISPQDLFADPLDVPSLSFHEAKDRIISTFEVRYVQTLLERHEGNVSRAAKEAGLSRNALYSLMKRVGLKE